MRGLPSSLPSRQLIGEIVRPLEEVIERDAVVGDHVRLVAPQRGASVPRSLSERHKEEPPEADREP